MAIDRQDTNRRLIKLAEGPNIRFWRIDYDQLSFAERVFELIWELESEANIGGFHQYFWNSTCALAPYVVNALHALGAVPAAALVQAALSWGGYVPGSDDDSTSA